MQIFFFRIVSCFLKFAVVYLVFKHEYKTRKVGETYRKEIGMSEEVEFVQGLSEAETTASLDFMKSFLDTLLASQLPGAHQGPTALQLPE